MVPVIGAALRNMALSRLSWSFSLSSDSDLPAQRAVELAVRSTQNSYYTAGLETMTREIRRGQSLHRAFEVTRRYPTDFLQALETGETSGQISETMAILAHQYQDQARMQLRVLTLFAGMLVMLLVMGIIIAMIFKMFFQVYQPLFDEVNRI
jgi:type II secretory pathway component PulF